MSNSRAMQRIILDHRSSGGHFFDAGAMAFFDSRIENYPVSNSNDRHNRRFFITSECFDDTTPRMYTIRYASTDPTTGRTSIEDFGDFQQYASLGVAASVITNLFDMALDIGWDAVVDTCDLR